MCTKHKHLYIKMKNYFRAFIHGMISDWRHVHRVFCRFHCPYEIICRIMSQYINIGNIGFASVRKGEYVDKSAAIQVINVTLDTEFCYSCVTRCRRFGKSMTSKMLNAYYDKTCDSRHLFEDLELSNFYDSSDVDPGIFARYFGFTEEETMSLAIKHDLDVKESKIWYEGYKIGDESIMYNPDSVMRLIHGQQYTVHWYGTSAYNSDIAPYMNDNFDGVKDYMTQILAGKKCKAAIGSDINDMVNFQTKEDVLALLVHLGYLFVLRRRKNMFCAK